MKIAMVAPVVKPIKADGLYGGIERIIQSLCRRLVERGEDVVLYCLEGSDLSIPGLKLATVTGPTTAEAEAALFSRMVKDQAKFDIIHSHIEPAIAASDSRNLLEDIKTPLMVTMHNQTYIEERIAYYSGQPKLHRFNYVFISHNQAKPLDFLPNQSVVYNGIELDEFTFNESPVPRLAFVGRITPEKGVAEAIAIAKQADRKLMIAAAIDPSQEDYWHSEIEPLVDGEQIRYLGEIATAEKDRLLAESEALLFPITWQEPFGLVMTEALACGTPVIASRIGSVPEIVKEGETGWLFAPGNVQAAAEMVRKVGELSRPACRKSVETRFTADIMAENYYNLMQELTS